MRQLFVRTYLVLAAIVIGGLALAGAWEFARWQSLDQQVMQTLVSAPDEVRAVFAAHDEATAVQRLQRTFDAHVRVLPLDPLPPLPPPMVLQLQQGRAVLPNPPGPPDLWVPLPDRGIVVHLVPPRSLPPPGPWVAAAVLLGLGVAVALQLLPLDRQLARLAQASQAFGQGDHHARVPVQARSPTVELDTQFNAMADRITQLLQDQQALLLAVSHELRTPLNRVRFAAELLASEPAPDARQTQLEGLQSDLDELDALVQELLMWGRARQRTRELTYVDPVEIAQSLLNAAKRLRPDLHTSVHGPQDLQLRLDEPMFRRALGNLIANARRHAASTVQVILHATASSVHVHVDDDGPGIPVTDRSRVLEPFVRLDAARARDDGGAGLGLALAHRVALAHDGALHIQDAPIGGARFTLQLPALTQADPA